jgi:hypothetical protein
MEYLGQDFMTVKMLPAAKEPADRQSWLVPTATGKKCYTSCPRFLDAKAQRAAWPPPMPLRLVIAVRVGCA